MLKDKEQELAALASTHVKLQADCNALNAALSKERASFISLQGDNKQLDAALISERKITNELQAEVRRLFAELSSVQINQDQCRNELEMCRQELSLMVKLHESERSRLAASNQVAFCNRYVVSC